MTPVLVLPHVGVHFLAAIWGIFMSQINILNLTFAYDGSHENIFENVSFSLDTRWRLGLTGRNGRGKTTLLNLLRGKLDSNGSISAPVEFDYFPFDVDKPELSVVEVVDRSGINCELWELERELSLLNMTDILERQFNKLSKGEQTKLMLAMLFLKNEAFLLIDEPTNHLDINARIAVGNYLKGKRGYILVSHDRTLLDNCTDHTMSINKTNIDVVKGNFSSWFENKQMQDMNELARNEHLKKDIKRLEASARRASNWADKVEKSKHTPLSCGLSADLGYIGHKAAKMNRRSKSIEARKQSAIEEKSTLLKDIETADALAIHPLNYHKERLISINKGVIAYGERIVCDEVTLTLNRGDRLALCGGNGSGKSSILKVVRGEISCREADIGSGLIISYVPQDASFLEGNMRDFSKIHNIDESLFKAILRKLDFSREHFDKDMCNISSGQKKKILIAKSLCEKAHLYIWDEPLNFIDVFSRMQIESLIMEHCPTMLFVEHDSAFVGKVSTSVYNL